MRPRPASGEIYHVYNRGVDKRKVFLDDEDRLRFIHDLFEFNDEEPAENIYYRRRRQSYEVGPRKIGVRMPRKLLVEILAFCIMKNHFHLMLRQKREGGITKFMHKLGTGYTSYFNQKYERVGALFQGKYKIAHLTADPHFVHLPYYIHLNPLDYFTPEWRERRISDHKKALKFLETYRWSSHLDYLGKQNFPSVTQREFLLNFFDGTKGYEKSISEWVRSLDLETIEGVTLE